MDIVCIEVTDQQATVATAEIQELTELQLAVVGGGIADVVVA
jgi:hypothetical protein